MLVKVYYKNSNKFAKGCDEETSMISGKEREFIGEASENEIVEATIKNQLFYHYLYDGIWIDTWMNDGESERPWRSVYEQINN